ncbi:MAG: T9SS type A sorting domain-containing protein [Bacteroidetes bacterium]|nr:MAG: T9SS type A sorting domain-containing protein [Bacteroidota bacterium]
MTNNYSQCSNRIYEFITNPQADKNALRVFCYDKRDKIVMKFLRVFLFLMLFFCGELHAQQWVQIPMSFSTGDTFLFGLSASFATKNIGWFTPQNGDLYKTTDGGYTWNLQLRKSGFFFNILALDSLHVWVRYGGYNKWVVFTTDGGAYWDSTFIGPGFSHYYGPLVFFNTTEGLLFDSILFHTSNGGNNWYVKNSADSLFFRRAGVGDFINRQKGWIGGGNPIATDVGYIAKTDDSGKSWAYSGYPTGHPIITGIDAIDTLLVYAVGFFPFSGTGVVRKSEDGGLTWNSIFLPGSGWPLDMKMLDSLTGWICGENGKIWKTTDGGNTWVIQITNTDVILWKISLLQDENVIYVFGDENTLLRSDIVASVRGNDGYPVSYRLYQNYPNPFNPMTIIHYQLYGHGFVSLKVYNMLGQEVAKLVNEMQDAGYKSKVWDAKGLPSGIYFYRLQAGSFTDIKKMVLMR